MQTLFQKALILFEDSEQDLNEELPHDPSNSTKKGELDRSILNKHSSLLIVEVGAWQDVLKRWQRRFQGWMAMTGASMNFAAMDFIQLLIEFSCPKQMPLSPRENFKQPFRSTRHIHLSMSFSDILTCRS